MIASDASMFWMLRRFTARFKSKKRTRHHECSNAPPHGRCTTGWDRLWRSKCIGAAASRATNLPREPADRALMPWLPPVRPPAPGGPGGLNGVSVHPTHFMQAGCEPAYIADSRPLGAERVARELFVCGLIRSVRAGATTIDRWRLDAGLDPVDGCRWQPSRLVAKKWATPCF